MSDRKPLILLVEDNEQNLELATYLLEEAGYEVAPARDARSVRAAFDGPAPSLVLMDMHLPGSDGLNLVRELRTRPDWKAVPVIALTAHAMRGDRERFLAGGCDDYIAKPVDTASFARQIAERLRAGRAGGTP